MLRPTRTPTTSSRQTGDGSRLASGQHQMCEAILIPRGAAFLCVVVTATGSDSTGWKPLLQIIERIGRMRRDWIQRLNRPRERLTNGKICWDGSLLRLMQCMVESGCLPQTGANQKISHEPTDVCIHSKWKGVRFILSRTTGERGHGNVAMANGEVLQENKTRVQEIHLRPIPHFQRYIA